MDESFEDPGTFDEDDYEEQEELDGKALQEARPAPDLNGLLSVSPLVRFENLARFSFLRVLCCRAYKARKQALRRSRDSVLPDVICRDLSLTIKSSSNTIK